MESGELQCHSFWTPYKGNGFGGFPGQPGPGAPFEVLEIEMLSIFRKLMKNEQGATAIEYTLIASLIAVAAIASMRTVGGKVSNVLSNVSNAMS